MKTRAKFKVDRVTHYGNKENRIEEITLTAVTAGEENKQWSRWTPCGTLTMSITNKALHGQFEPDTEFYLDLTPVSTEEA